MDGDGSERRKGPAHARSRALPAAGEKRLGERGTQVAPRHQEDDEFRIVAGLRASRRRRHLLAWGVVFVVAALAAGAITQWVRPLPALAVHTVGVRLPGPAPSITWPSTGEAALWVEGIGALGQVRGSQPVPVAGLAEILTAYVVLSDHPLPPGRDGPAIPVTADTLASYQAGQGIHESEVPVAPGETLTEMQALEGLLVDAGADMATLLADWDAGNVGAFVTKMNTAGAKLGLSSTHITDPSGADPGTTSTAEDLVRLGQAALTVPVLAQIVSLGQASVPMSSVVYNLNFDLGRDGIIGIKSGSDSIAQGCYLFAAKQSVGGKDVTVVGAVLGQPGGGRGPNTAAVDAGDALVKSAFAALHSFTLFAPGQTAGRVHAAWGATAPLTVAQPVIVIGWPGLAVSLTTRTRTVRGPLASGAMIGTLRAGIGTSSVQTILRTARPVAGPGVWWRVSR